MKRLPSLKQLRHLIGVADFRHFGRAAEACFITQSSLSASIKELETLLGKILIERTRRSVMLTPLGKDVVARSRKVLVDVEQIVDLVDAAGPPLSGPLRLGVIPTIAPFALPRILPALRKSYSDLKLFIREDQSARLIDGLAAGELDLILLAFPYPAVGLEIRLMGEDPFLAAFPEGHRFENKKSLSGADLEGEELLLLEEGHCLRDQAMSACRLAGEVTSAEFQATSLNTLAQMVDNGLGLTLLPKMAVDAGLTKATKIKTRPIVGKGFFRQIGFAWRPASSRKEEFSLFTDFFQERLGLQSNVSTSKTRPGVKK